jgi:hypothetical protein
MWYSTKKRSASIFCLQNDHILQTSSCGICKYVLWDIRGRGLPIQRMGTKSLKPPE